MRVNGSSEWWERVAREWAGGVKGRGASERASERTRPKFKYSCDTIAPHPARSTKEYNSPQRERQKQEMKNLLMTKGEAADDGDSRDTNTIINDTLSIIIHALLLISIVYID